MDEKLKETDDDNDVDFINKDLDAISLNDEEIRNHLNLNINNNIVYNEHHIVNDGDNKQQIDDNDYMNFEDEQILTDLIVTSLPSELFQNEQLKQEFENMFKKYALIESNTNNNGDCGDNNESSVKFYYFRILKRCTVKFNNESAALNARYELDNQLFLGEMIRVFFAQPIKLKNSRKFLEPPDNERTFLISPPASPPVGWESTHEDPPVVNLNLIAALSTLTPHEPYELIESKDNIPGIVLHPCPDAISDPNDTKPKKFIPTRRPASDMS